MIAQPKVSIVVAAYNVGPYLARCVRSLLAQTERSIEVLIVDDGSTDQTPQVIKGIAAEDSRAVHVRRENGGLSAARNSGLRAATGEFICFVDGDDWVEPTMVESMVASCKATESQVAIAGAYVDFHDRADELVRSEKRLMPGWVILRGGPLHDGPPDHNFLNLVGYAWNKIYRREWLQDLGIVFEEGLSLIEDIDFNAQVLARAERTVLVSDAFVHYVQRPRRTLGTTHDETFLSKHMRAIDAVDSLLAAWGVDREVRSTRFARACSLSLWSASRSAATKPHASQRMRRMLEQPGADRLLLHAQEHRGADWRSAWATATMKRGLYGVALLPARAIRAMQSLTEGPRLVSAQLRKGSSG
ncbi:glycosyltransferase family 2 protein [Microbacterium alcoholitolerans]|uniref:glycosyltransferase family 2 protein n=1 Tax=unclassified Microbacterium TaxID=2609290 RepID=UPI003D17F639